MLCWSYYRMIYCLFSEQYRTRGTVKLNHILDHNRNIGRNYRNYIIPQIFQPYCPLLLAFVCVYWGSVCMLTMDVRFQSI